MPKKVNESQKKEILDLFIKGTNIKDISKIYNFTLSTITKQLKNLVGDEEFIKLKSSNLKVNNSNNKKLKNSKKIKFIESNLSSENNKSSEDIKSDKGISNSEQLSKQEKLSEDSLFIEIAPIDYEIENTKQKDLSSISLSEINLPKIVYMIVDQKIELEIKLLKDYPEWNFLSQEDLNRKTIKIYFDLKSAKIDCTKDQKVIKVPNTNVFKIVSPILISRGISRIVSSDQLIAL